MLIERFDTAPRHWNAVSLNHAERHIVVLVRTVHSEGSRIKRLEKSSPCILQHDGQRAAVTLAARQIHSPQSSIV